YAALILSWTSLPLDPADVHRIGNERFDAIQEERFAIAARLGYASPDEAIAAHRASGEDTADSSEAIVELVRDQVTRSWEIAPQCFGGLPREICEVRAVEASREPDMPAAFYNAPTEDGSRPGVYYINTYDLPSRDLHVIAGVTAHE